MRRFSAFLLALIMVLSVSGCSKEPEIIENSAVLGSVPDESKPDRIEINPVESESSMESENESEQTSSDSESSSSEPESSSSSSSSKAESSSSKKSSSSSSSESTSSVSESSVSESETEEENPPVNTPSDPEEIRAVWISYLEYQSVLQGKTKKQFTNNIKTMFANIAADGFNTVFVHARSHSDAMYDSDIYPWSVYCTGTEGNNPGFDPLEIMVTEAHRAGLRIEAWINPYRVKGNSNTAKIASSSPAYRWLDTEKVVVLEGKGIFYNPADRDVINLVVSGVEEIVRNYDVDGIHFDDYFYPTTDESFDKNYYNQYKSSGGKLKLAAWRRQNVNTLIKVVYSAIKATDSSCRFGVSPAGNTEQNYNTLYCDVETWVTSNGYVDYICPQIYFGFNNKSRPYLDVLAEFSNMITNKNVDLIIGLAAYKAGAVDTYAGENGKNEWINNNDILSRQITSARSDSKYSGFALYRYDSLYNPSAEVKNAVRAERANLDRIL
ncbi:MAG: family 10 glycosylhydrolase [Oscillospiraceae bacterium]|nr:family 10 glycosylhydrolase [Oscillospiraceae bacterium]